jgi:S1-C subfamily serine protease
MPNDSIIALFERVSPSVVQVVGRQNGDGLPSEDEGVQSGTGFVWDGAGNIVTNNHVIDGVGDVVVRLASGEPGLSAARAGLRGIDAETGTLGTPCTQPIPEIDFGSISTIMRTSPGLP